MFVTLGAGLSFPAVAWATDDGSDVQDLRDEVSRLRGQLQALQGAIAEATEMERQRDVAIVSALKQPAASPQPAAPPSAAPVAANDVVREARGTNAPAAASADDKRPGAARHRRHRRAARSRSK
jgi:hypothetical protein